MTVNRMQNGTKRTGASRVYLLMVICECIINTQSSGKLFGAIIDTVIAFDSL